MSAAALSPLPIATSTRWFDIEKLRSSPLIEQPFPYLIVSRFLNEDGLEALARDYPAIAHPGSFPVGEVAAGREFLAFIDELQGPLLRQAFEEKFRIDLTDRPTMVTVRGRAQAKDGRIHTDSDTKIITVLIYMNGRWEEPGGRLRLLSRGDDLNAVIAEVPPEEGTLLAFRVSSNSWHGHEPFIGVRRVIQLNWVTDANVVRHEQKRHRLSARLKKLFRR